MASYTKVKLSGSTDGMGVLLAGNVPTGTLIHTADASALDELYLWAESLATGTQTKLTLEFGSALPANNIEVNIDPKAGLYLVVPGLLLTNSKTVRGYGSTANTLVMYGFVNRITS